MLEKLRELLQDVPRTYYDFQRSVLEDCADNEDAQKKMIDFIQSNPEATAGDILVYLDDEVLQKEPMNIIIVDDDELYDENGNEIDYIEDGNGE